MLNGNRKEIEEEFENYELIFADGFDDSIIGVTQPSAANNYTPQVLYDYYDCIDTLHIRDAMSWDDAVEFFEYNTLGAYIGPNTPLFV